MARRRTIYVSEFDLKRLSMLIAMFEDEPASRDRKHLDALDDELRRAQIVAPEKIPGDVVTMGSRVRVMDLSTGAETIYELVFPGDADVGKNKISVLAPIGTALIGFRAGDTVEWEVPAGVKRLRIEEILYQPEAAGDFHL